MQLPPSTGRHTCFAQVKFIDNSQNKMLYLFNNHFLLKEEETPYIFLVNDREVTETILDVLDTDKLNTEQVLDIVYQQQAVFRVRPVTRCTR